MAKEKRFAVVDDFLMRLTNVLVSGYTRGWEPIIKITEGERFVGFVTQDRSRGMYGLICDLAQQIQFLDAQTVKYEDEAESKQIISILETQKALVSMLLWRQIIQELDDPSLDNIEYERIALRDGWKVVVLDYR